MIHIIFTISILAGLTLVTLSIVSLVSNNFQFWPPPSRYTWQYRVLWLLFRIFVIGISLLSIFDYHGNGNISYIGIFLALAGFGSAFLATFSLGWKNSHGEPVGLKTNGWYSWSRNPTYVVSIVGMLGLSLIVNSTYLNYLLSLWALLYIVAPFLEEPWLEEMYGKDYLAYKAKVPRYIGFIRTRF